MKYFSVPVSALVFAGFALAASSPAQAEVRYVKRSVSPYVACYDRVYVPATVKVNTRGRLVRRSSTSWVTSDTRWDLMRAPAVYIQTSRTVEADHYTLVARGC
jgi:hypothetical protein